MTLLPLNAVLILAVVAAIHLYLYKRLVKETSRKGSIWRRTGTVLVWLLFALVMGMMAAGPAEALLVIHVLDWPSRLWLGLLPYLVAALLLGEVVRPLLRLGFTRAAKDTPAPPVSQDRNHLVPEPGSEDRAKGEETEDEPSDKDRKRDSETSRRIFISRGIGVGAVTLAGGMSYVESMVGAPLSQGPGDPGIEISLPFTGLWRVENSPARRVPSHGTDMFGGRYAIDFVGVDDRHRTADSRSWRTFLATESPEIFFSFGRPILAPSDGTVVAVHDAEIDHEARRSQTALIPYALSQGARARQGIGAIAGNYVVMSLPKSHTFIALVHFQAGSIRVSVGEKVVEGQHIANCGNSGNSTQPHVHIQAMDSADPTVARGIPMRFRRFREWPSGLSQSQIKDLGIPAERAVVEPLGHDD